MERVRGYLSANVANLGNGNNVAAIVASTLDEDARNVDDEDTRSFLSSGRVDGRSSDAKSIGSLSQHFFESDDNEDERYYGTCNGYASQPGSKSNLLLCSECDSRARTCTYRPQTPSQYGRFVEERIDRQYEAKNLAVTRSQQQERRSSTIATPVLKSPARIEGSPRYRRETENGRDDERDERRTKGNSASLTPIVLQESEQIEGNERHQRDTRIHGAKSPCFVYKSPTSVCSPRYRDIEQRAPIRWTGNEREQNETEERKVKRSQERYVDARSPVQLRSPRISETETRGWTRREDGVESSLSEDQRDYGEESPPCPLCNGSNVGLGEASSRCAHCNFTGEQDDPDLICFQCQMSAEEETTSVEGSTVCPKCENACQTRYATRSNGSSSCQTASSSSESSKYPVDAVVKIQVNNCTIDVDSDDTADADASNKRDETCAGSQGTVERLETILEIKNDTASENSEDNNGAKINGQPRAKYLNYMIVLIL